MFVKRDKLHCADCIHSTTFEVKEQDENTGVIFHIDNYECNNSNVELGYLENFDWDFSKAAEECRHFESVVYEGTCRVCQTEFKGKLTEWPYWLELEMEYIAFCSPECRDKFKAKHDVDVQEEYLDTLIENEEILDDVIDESDNDTDIGRENQ